ncbi:MAG: tetratricopeptide repeat protein, partial [Nitrospirales bacterium]
ALLLQGIVARTREQHEQAESLYTQAWEYAPDNYQVKAFLAPLWASWGRTLLLNNEPEEASRWLNKAFQVNETNPNVLFDLGVLASQESDDRRAIQLYTKTLDEFPDWPQGITVKFNLGLSHYRMESYVQAVQLFQQVARAEPSSVNAHFNLANSLAKTGKYEEASLHYRTVLRLAPDHQQAQDNYVEIIKWVKPQEDNAS